MKKLGIILIVLTVLFMYGCEELFIENDEADNPVENFDFLWQNMSERYSLFDYKNIDWDSIYSIYRPMVNEQTTDTDLFNTMATMINTLEDGHTNLRSPIDIARFLPYLDHAPNFSFDLAERNYLKIDYRFTGFLLNQILDDVGYIYYRSFQQTINDWELDSVINRFNRAGVKGVIIDIRDNGGGNPANGLLLMERLVDNRTHIYTSQKKAGPGRNNFLDPQDIFIDPNTKHPHFPGKVIVLSNRKVYSAGSYFSAATKALPEVILMGDTTGGGSGVPAGFELPNGWACNYSSTIGTLADGFNFEGGVPPDVYVEMDTTDLLNGIDTIIEAALTEIRDGL